MNKLFVPFITAGYPSLDITRNIILEFNDMGISYIELGIPYSDPLADGPTIQKASEIALANGTNLDNIFAMLQDIRDSISSNIIIFSYYNPLYVYGFRRFCEQCKKNSIYGVLIPDLPYEEEKEVKDILNEFALILIPLVTPTSEARLSKILAQKNQGFIYCVSSLGVTGERQNFHTNLENFIKKIRAVSSLSVVVGFGISNKKQAEHIGAISDGVVVGSKIINIITEAYNLLSNQSNDTAISSREIAKYVRKNVEDIVTMDVLR